MSIHQLRLRGKGTSWHKVEAPTLAKAKKKLVKGSFYKDHPNIIKDVLVRKGKP
jgi:hypothetical protein